MPGKLAVVFLISAVFLLVFGATLPSSANAMPSFGHDASEIRPGTSGTFGSGDYRFPNKLIALGNVGIGTISPSNKLAIVGSTDTHVLNVSDGSIHYGSYIGSLSGGGSGISIGSITNNQLRLFTNNQDRITITADGNVGIGTLSPNAKLQVSDGTVWFNGTTGSTPTSGAGTRMMWIPAKAAFRAGSVSGTQWDDANIGTNSTAFGYNTKASGSYSTAMGSLTSASAENTIVLGMGVDNSNMLVNNIERSLMVGFNSNIPTLFVGSSSGVGTTGNIGIGTTDPKSKLQVNGYIQIQTRTDAPPDADCNEDIESGRMVYDHQRDLMYICSGAPAVGSNAWKMFAPTI